MSPDNIKEGNKTIIIGGSSTAVLLARRLHLHGKKVIIIEQEKNRFRDIEDKGVTVIHGNACDKKIFDKIHLKHDNYVVIETGDDEQNLKISKMLRNEYQHENIISRISRFSLDHKFKQLGIETIDVTQILATAIENLIIRPTTYHALVESFENYSVEEIQVTNQSIDGSQIKEIPFHKSAILMMVRRKNSFFIPHGDTYLKIGDMLLVFGTNSAFDETRNLLV